MTARLHYWPPSGNIGIFHDELGQSVPRPGMLGVMNRGLYAIASAGNRFSVRTYPAHNINSWRTD